MIVVVSNIETTSVLLDNSATSHMFTDQAQFILYEKVTNAHITVDSNNKVPAIGIGSVSFRTRVLKGYLDVVLNNVLYIPYLEASLISIGILQWDRDQLQDCGGRVSIIIDGRELFKAMLTGTTGTLYYVQYTVELENHNAYLLKKSTMWLWHQRLKHLNSTIINLI